MKFDNENPYTEGERSIVSKVKKDGEPEQKAQPIGKIDKRKLIIYSEILKPKF